ncbi:MAG: cytochrome c biogenesis protein ResB [Candidatus Hydrogenedentes bacterium]|nr:cytochrome c biogenesis protein ResB [Candidatus Hydrogenedentota bacterium]
MSSLLRAPLRIAGSYWITIATLFLLLVLTFLGTLEQVEHGLYVTQQKYFNSIFLLHQFGDTPIILPLPGVYLLLIVLAVNLTCGALIRLPRAWSHAGVWISHLGILVLLAGGLVTFKSSVDGHLTFYEGESSDEFQSYGDWEIMIAQVGETNARVIPGTSFSHLAPGQSSTFKSADLPFTLTISDFTPNSMLTQEQGSGRVVNGMALKALERDPEQERNVAGVYVTLRDTASGAEQQGILWGMARNPFQAKVGDKTWTFTLQKRRWKLPFMVKLDKFERELYPGTNMPKAFSSDVTVTEGSTVQKFHIAMNKPLRYRGYTLFQASWGPQDARPGEPLFSSLAVVKNPADQWPLYACVIITIGLLFHFGLRLLAYLQQQRESRT